jgi:hypothetical protein
MRALAVVLALAVLPAAADSRHPPVANETWKAECGACHAAFPPRTLDAAAWRRVMASLERHYGADARLDAASAREIAAFLEAYAGRHADEGPGLPRITRTRWFMREHRTVDAAAWRRPAIGSPVNCPACHTDAERGEYRERAIRIPR